MSKITDEIFLKSETDKQILVDFFQDGIDNYRAFETILAENTRDAYDSICEDMTNMKNTLCEDAGGTIPGEFPITITVDLRSCSIEEIQQNYPTINDIGTVFMLVAAERDGNPHRYWVYNKKGTIVDYNVLIRAIVDGKLFSIKTETKETDTGLAVRLTLSRTSNEINSDLQNKPSSEK